MAEVLGNEATFRSSGGSAYNVFEATYKAVIYYSTSSTNTSYTVNVSDLKVREMRGSGGSTASTTMTASYSFSGDGYTSKTGSYSANFQRTGDAVDIPNGWGAISGGSVTYTRTTSAQTKTIKFRVGESLATLTITVPALPSYTISYNANGGSGAPGSQTKWYGTNITLSSTRPTRTNYTFAGWATSSTGAVAYQPGSTYSANSGATLYARWSFTLIYDANTGSGAPGNQTKYVGTNITLSANKPEKEGYTFKGWATSAANAAAGTVDYAPGATYASDTATNSVATLYAVWELTYNKPTITDLSVERCNQDGSANDEGKYAKVAFNWSVFNTTAVRYIGGSSKPYSSNGATCSITVGSVTVTPSLSGSSGSVSRIISSGTTAGFDVDTQYDVTVVVTDTQQVVSSPDNKTTITSSLTTSKFPMDFNSTATAVGFFMPAPNSLPTGAPSTGMFVNGDIYLDLPDYNASGTVDYDLYEAIVALGWEDDVLVD